VREIRRAKINSKSFFKN